MLKIKNILLIVYNLRIPIVITEVLRATTTPLRYFPEEATSNLGARVEGCQEPFLFLPGPSWEHILPEVHIRWEENLFLTWGNSNPRSISSKTILTIPS